MPRQERSHHREWCPVRLALVRSHLPDLPFRYRSRRPTLPHWKSREKIIDLETATHSIQTGRISGKKKVSVTSHDATDGVVILKYKSKYCTCILKDCVVRINELVGVQQKFGMANP